MWGNLHGREAIQVQKLWQEFLNIKLLENTWEDPLSREAKVQSVSYLKQDKGFSRSSSLKEHESKYPHRREAFQMQV